MTKALNRVDFILLRKGLRGMGRYKHFYFFARKKEISF
ncbi:Hypothetical protein BN2458_PEG0847 [Helicobacter typhlonius]|uniref:Uncharacterized protein n=1 Tax=Helicobacter typhlonius TaxID=76936 RepID=A0A0S4PU48_9HELI|nr:Hypothetical protein BN2458_PEG0847 [Helicobacter typhlonius]